MGISTARRACALLAAFLAGGFTGSALFYSVMLIDLICKYFIFNTGGGCLGYNPLWFEASEPYLLSLGIFLSLTAGIYLGAFVRKKVLQIEWYP